MVFHFLFYVVTYFLFVLGLVWKQREEPFLKRLGGFLKLLLWPKAWVRQLDLMILGRARAIVAAKEKMEAETKRLEKKERLRTHHKGFKKSSAYRRRQGTKRAKAAELDVVD